MLAAPATAPSFADECLTLSPCRFERGAWGKAALLFLSRYLQNSPSSFLARNEHAVLLEVGLVV